MPFMDTIDITKTPDQIKLQLALPNKTVIGSLKSAYGINRNLKLGGVNELSFNLPFDEDIRNELVRNKHIDKIKEKYFIKAKVGLKEEWYIIDSITNSSDESNDIKTISCFSLQQELADKLVKSYKVYSDPANPTIETPQSATYILEDLLVKYQNISKSIYVNDTSGDFWKVGYIDADFDIKMRLFSFDGGTLLDAVFQLAEVFGALIVFDTLKRKIDFYNVEKYGVDRGLTVSYKKYLKSINEEFKMDNVVTRLKVYGKDGISIHSVNQTGTGYLEDLTYFMYPFERDATRKVLKSSYYMTDSLCHALLDYKNKVDSKTGEFETVLNDLNAKQVEIDNKQNQIDKQNDQIKAKQEQYDVALEAGDTEQQTTLTSEINNLKSQLYTYELDMETLQIQKKNLQANKDAIKADLDIENNFTVDQIKERNRFIVEKEWSNDNIVKPKDLYNEAVKKFAKMKEPQITMTISLVDFTSIIEGQRDWDKLNLGDIITVHYEKFGTKKTVKIIEIDFDHESDEVTLTIASVKDLMSDKEEFLKMLQKAASASTTIDQSRFKWDSTVENTSEIARIVDVLRGNAKEELNLAVNDNVTIDRRGITIISPSDPNRFLRATHGVIAITNNGGNTFDNAITTEGIIGERIFGKILAGAKLTIDASDTNGNKIFTVDGNGLSMDVSDSAGAKVFSVSSSGLSMNINDKVGGNKVFSVSSDGVVIKGTSLTISDGGISESNISNTATEKWNSTNSLLNDIVADNKLTASEKVSIKKEWDIIVSEKTKMNSHATAYGVSTTNYDTSYKTLSDYISPILADLTTTSDIDGSVMRANFKDYYDKRILLLNSITNGISVGGRNLLKNSTGLLGKKYWTDDPNVSVEVVDNQTSFKITATTSTSINFNSNRFALKPSTQYTITYYQKGDSGVSCQLNIRGRKTGSINDYDSGYGLGLNDTVTTSFKKVVGTFTTKSDIQDVYFNFTHFGNGGAGTKSLWIHSVQIEEGNKDTSWTPAVEDVKEDIDTRIQENKTYSNGVRIDSTNGVVVTRSDDNIRSIQNATSGFKIQKKGTSWSDATDIFYVDTSGKLMAENLIATKFTLKDGSSGGKDLILIDGTTKKIDFGEFTTILGKTNFMKGLSITDSGGKTTFAVDASGNVTINGNITMSGGSISWSSVGKPSYNYSEIGGTVGTDKPPANADNTTSTIGSQRLTNITSTGVYTGTVQCNQLLAGTITATIAMSSAKITTQKAGDNGYIILGDNADSNPRIRFYGSTEAIIQTGGGNLHINTANDSSNTPTAGNIHISAGVTTFFYRAVDFSNCTSINWGTNSPSATAKFG